MNIQDAKSLRMAPLTTPTDLKSDAVRDISGALNILLADVFALYVKTKNFHWHMSGPHFRDYHLLLDEQAEQIFASTDAIAERVRKIGGTTLRSIGQISRFSACWTTTRTSSTRCTCSPNCATTTSSWLRTCARRTPFATSRETWPAQVCSRSGSTRPRDARGFCSRPAVPGDML